MSDKNDFQQKLDQMLIDSRTLGTIKQIQDELDFQRRFSHETTETINNANLEDVKALQEIIIWFVERMVDRTSSLLDRKLMITQEIKDKHQEGRIRS